MSRVETVRRLPYKELSLPQLRSFCEVCRTESYAAAARTLLLTTAAVWEQIKGLERQYGMTLFQRDGQRVIPTLHGKRLLRLARPALAELESFADVLHQEDGVYPELVTIVTHVRVLREEISRAAAQFKQRYPAIRLVIRYTQTSDVMPCLLEDEADLALTLIPGPEEAVATSIIYEPAGELDFLLLTPARHPLVRAKSLRLETILQHPLILGERDTFSRRRADEVFHRHNLIGEMNIATETSSDEYTPSYVRVGLGLGLSAGKADSPLYHGLGVRLLRRWFGTARIAFMWRRGAHIAPLQRELADLIRSNLSGPRR